MVWFGEPLPVDALAAATAAAGASDVFLSVGTSSVVYPAAGLVDVAKRAGAKLVEVNPGETPLSGDMDVVLRGTAGAVLAAVVAEVTRA